MFPIAAIYENLRCDRFQELKIDNSVAFTIILKILDKVADILYQIHTECGNQATPLVAVKPNGCTRYDYS